MLFVATEKLAPRAAPARSATEASAASTASTARLLLLPACFIIALCVWGPRGEPLERRICGGGAGERSWLFQVALGPLGRRWLHLWRRSWREEKRRMPLLLQAEDTELPSQVPRALPPWYAPAVSVYLELLLQTCSKKTHLHVYNLLETLKEGSAPQRRKLVLRRKFRSKAIK